MFPANLENLTSSDISELVSEQARESRTLEFKRDQIGFRDEDKREFLADISAIANSQGGELVIGIEDADGIATRLAPLSLQSPEAEIQRLENIIRSGLEPRLPKCEFKWVGADLGGFIVIRVPRSWAAPHRVAFRDHAKFYARSSTGKYSMDVNELRAAFNSAEALTSKVHEFRKERMNLIRSDECPVALNAGAKLLFHIIPQSALLSPITITPNEDIIFPPMQSSGCNYLHTLEGFATYSGREDSDSSRTYTLVFRNGIVEAAAHIGYEGERGNVIHAASVEGGILQSSRSYFRNLRKLDIAPPFLICMTIFGVQNYTLYSGNHFYDPPRKQRRDVLMFPEVLTEEPEPDMQILFRPVFDMFWQAFGRSQSFSFNDQGQYVGGR